MWNKIWSSTHGPSLITEVALASSTLDVWRNTCVAKKDNTPIFCAVKTTQTVFNGYGAQETCDMLVEALIHPSMPAFTVCSDDTVWARFSAAVFSYQKERIRITTERPFRFNKDTHHRFLAHVIAYRRSHIKVTQDNLTRIQALELLNPCAIIQNNGSAVGKFTFPIWYWQN